MSASASKQQTVLGQIDIGLAALMMIGIGLIIVGQRRKLFKSAYRRELDNIYRYHDGIIIRATALPDIQGKRVVPVRSFDDMLNLEEELKVPIVASETGDEATRFMIIPDDVVYMYLLGVLPSTDTEVMREIRDAFDNPSATHVAKKSAIRRKDE